MADVLILVCKQEDIACYHIINNRIEQVVTIDFDPKRLFAWLKKFPNMGIHLLLDLVEEEVYVEPSPMLFPWEQDNYGQRQIRKRFPKTSFCQYRFEPQNVPPWKSRVGFLQLSGFNDDAQLTTLLSWLETAQHPVLSISSVGLLLPELFRHVWFSYGSTQNSWRSRAHFLLMRTNGDTFRQALVVNGELRATRLVQFRDYDPQPQMQQLLQEIRLLDKFVRAQKIVGLDQQLDLYYIGSNPEDAALAWQVFADTPYSSAGAGSFIAISSCAPDDLIKQEPQDILYFLLAQHTASQGNYRPKAVEEAALYNRIRLGLWFVLAFAVTGMLGYAAFFVAQSALLESAIQQHQDKYAYFQKINTQLSAQLKLDVPIDQLKQSVEFVDYVQSLHDKQRVLPYFQQMSDVLRLYPMIKLNLLNWTPTIDKLDATLFSLEIDALILADINTTLRQVMQTMDNFLLELGKQTSIEQVQLIQKPIDLDSSKALTIVADDRSEGSREYPFKLKLVFKKVSP